MESLIPPVNVWNNAFDHASAASSTWRAQTAAAANVGEGDKENRRPEPEAADVDAEINHITAEIARASRLYRLRTMKQPLPGGADVDAEIAHIDAEILGPLEVAATATANPNPPLSEKQPPRAAQGLKPIKPAPAPRAGGSASGPSTSPPPTLGSPPPRRRRERFRAGAAPRGRS
ncbi:unnamed protein product [Urochloa humidicola]